MRERTLYFDKNRINKKEFHKSKQPIDLMSMNIDQTVMSDKFKHSDEALLVTKKVKLLNRYALSYFRLVDTSNTLKTVAKACLF